MRVFNLEENDKSLGLNLAGIFLTFLSLKSDSYEK